MESVLSNAIRGGFSEIDTYIANSSKAILEQRVHSSGDTILHLVCANGNCLHAVGPILAKHPKLLFKVNYEGNSALHVAARAGHTSEMSALLRKRDPRDRKNIFWLKNKIGNTAVHEATIYNRTEVVRALLRENRPGICYSFNKEGETPLYLAANRGFHEIVRLIVTTIRDSQEISPNYEGPNGRTALHAAVICNGAESVATLLQWDKNLVHCKDSNDQLPIHYAASSGFGGLICQILKVDPSIAYVGNAQGRNLLHIAIENNRTDAINHLLQEQECKWLIDSLITKRDDHGNTPLHLLATSECNITELIDHPMNDQRAVNKDGMTPLDLYYKNLSKSPVPTDDQIAIAEKLKLAGSTWNIQTPSNQLPFSHDEIRSMAETQMIVSALIATVAFTAGFALPGGYVSSGSPYEGMAVLSVRGGVRGSGTLAFRAFIVFNFFAMLCSTSSLFMYFLITVNSRRMTEDTLNFLANEGIGLNIIGLGAIVLAFCAQTTVVLHHSKFPTIHSSPGLFGVIVTFIAVLISIRCVQKGGYSFFDIFQPRKWSIVRRIVTFVKYLSRRRKDAGEPTLEVSLTPNTRP